MKATEQISEWSSDRVIATEKKLIQLARHAIKNGQPNLINEHEASDLTVLVDSFEEHVQEAETVTGLEHLPEMSEEMASMPSTPPSDVATTEGEQVETQQEESHVE